MLVKVGGIQFCRQTDFKLRGLHIFEFSYILLMLFKVLAPILRFFFLLFL